LFFRKLLLHLSDFKTWFSADHAEEWLVFPENIGKRLSIDETSLSNGELYTAEIQKKTLARSRYLLFKSPDKAYSLTHSLRMIRKHTGNFGKKQKRS